VAPNEAVFVAMPMPTGTTFSVRFSWNDNPVGAAGSKVKRKKERQK